MKRTTLRFLLTGSCAYLGMCAWLYAAQDNLLYFPTAEVTSSEAEALRLDSGAATLKIWKFGAGSNALIYFGGNGEDVARNINKFNIIGADSTVYLLNYRGYGGSSGEPGESAFLTDAAFLFDYVSERHSAISVIGRSLGSGVATWLAAHRPVDKMILVTPYDSIEEVAADAYPFAPISLLLRDKFRSIDYVSAVKAPTLILIAETDNIVPHTSTQRLLDRFPPDQVTVHVVQYANHNTIANSPEYVQLIRHFLQDRNSRREDLADSTLRTSL